MNPQKFWISITIIIMVFSSFGWCESKTSLTTQNKSQRNKLLVAKKSEPRKIAKVSNNNALRQLQQNVNLSDLRSDMSLVQAIEILRNSTRPSARIVVFWGQLEQIDVSPASPIYMDGISQIPLQSALKLLLSSVSDARGQLDYWVSGGVIVIGTKDSKPKDKVTQLYNVCDLTSAPAEYYALGRGVNQRQAGGMGFGSYNQPFGQMGIGGYGQSRYGGGGLGARYGGQGMYGRGGGYGNFGTRTMGLRTGTSLSLGGGAYGYGGYNQRGWGGGMGMGGMGMGGMGMYDVGMQYRQQQLAGLIKNTIEPGTWNQ